MSLLNSYIQYYTCAMRVACIGHVDGGHLLRVQVRLVLESAGVLLVGHHHHLAGQHVTLGHLVEITCNVRHEQLIAYFTFERLVRIVLFNVLDQQGEVWERLHTQVAGVALLLLGFFCLIVFHVLAQFSASGVPSTTESAAEWFKSIVQHHVRGKSSSLSEPLPAQFALVLLHAGVNQQMFLHVCLLLERLVTELAFERPEIGVRSSMLPEFRQPHKP